MASVYSHKSSTSNLELPHGTGDKVERKRPNRVPPPPAPIDIPEPVDVKQKNRRTPSPLRNSYTAGNDSGSEDGSDVEDDEHGWSQHSQSPSPSITKFATNFANRVGQFVGNRSSSHLPTDSELEAEAERERERSRREAELIMRREAEERRALEAKVMAMFEESSTTGPNPRTPPPRSHTMPSPSPSQKDKEGWLSAVKNKLTPTKEKESLTPAQQIVQDTKAKDKGRKKDKGKEREKSMETDKGQMPPEWPATPSRKYSDPAFLNLAQTDSPEPVTPPRPIRDSGYMTPSPGPSVGSNRDGPPLYAQFNSQGILDVPDTLLTIARRFEKLERWTVSHVRALEDRMGDVERWLVDKEKEKEETQTQSASEKSSFHSEEDDDADDNIAEIREELVELQGRVGELGREMAKLMTAPLNLTSGPARNMVVSQAQLSPGVPPTPTSIAPRSLPTVPATTTPKQISPPPAAQAPPRPAEASPPPDIKRPSSVVSSGSARTRLPYPTGDYTSPPGAIPTKQDILSPTNSPPSSLNESARKRPLSISGLPSASSSMFQSSSGVSTPGLPQRQESTHIRALSPRSPPSASGSPIQTNVSPTPRKRYTVALGTPLAGYNAPDSDEEDQRKASSTSSSMRSVSDVFEDSQSSGDNESDVHVISHSREDTIGKSESRIANPPSMPNDTLKRGNSVTSPGKEGNPIVRNPHIRTRAQSSYGPPTGFNASMLGNGIGLGHPSQSSSNSPAPITPLRLRVRSKSIDRIGLGIGTMGAPLGMANASGRFVDPLVLRKQEQDAGPRTPRTPLFDRGKKVPVNELVAYFDKDKQRG